MDKLEQLWHNFKKLHKIKENFTVMRFAPVNYHTMQRTFKSGFYLATIAAASLLVSLPASAKSCPGASASASPRLVAGAPTTTTATTANSATVVEIAASNSSFSTLVAAIKAAGLAETLSGKGPFTVFAPTNEAFAALPAGTVEELLKPENKAKLQKVLTYHVVAGEVTSAAIKPGQVKTVEGSTVTLSVKDGKIKVNNASVISADIDASNGVIHVIDQVILPPNL